MHQFHLKGNLLPEGNVIESTYVTLFFTLHARYFITVLFLLCAAQLSAWQFNISSPKVKFWRNWCNNEITALQPFPVLQDFGITYRKNFFSGSTAMPKRPTLNCDKYTGPGCSDENGRLICYAKSNKMWIWMSMEQWYIYHVCIEFMVYMETESYIATDYKHKVNFSKKLLFYYESDYFSLHFGVSTVFDIFKISTARRIVALNCKSTDFPYRHNWLSAASHSGRKKLRLSATAWSWLVFSSVLLDLFICKMIQLLGRSWLRK